jgi:hypothetical protein
MKTIEVRSFKRPMSKALFMSVKLYIEFFSVDMSLFNDFLALLWHFTNSLPAIIVLSIAGALTFLNYLTSPRYNPFEPPPLPHFLPFLAMPSPSSETNVDSSNGPSKTHP